MKLTYTVTVDDVFEEYVFEGTVDEVVAAWKVFDFEDPDPSECILTGRSCLTCEYGKERGNASCRTCGAHYANYMPVALGKSCSSCKHRDLSGRVAPCRDCHSDVSHPFWEPRLRYGIQVRQHASKKK